MITLCLKQRLTLVTLGQFSSIKFDIGMHTTYFATKVRHTDIVTPMAGNYQLKNPRPIGL